MTVPSIRISLGMRGYLEHQRMLIIHGVPVLKITPHMAWSSLNRQGDIDSDLERLRWEFPNTVLPEILRRELDSANAPSMSVGDEIRWFSEPHKMIRHIECRPVGWHDYLTVNPLDFPPLTERISDDRPRLITPPSTR